MNWLLLENIYIVILAVVCLRIVYDTRSSTKAVGYLLFAVFVPVVGIIFYLFFGTNYRKRKIYTEKFIDDELLAARIQAELFEYSKKSLLEAPEAMPWGKSLATMLFNDNTSPFTVGNNVRLLINGEEKFPEVLNAIRSARHHIHIGYYIYEDDEIGREIEQLLIEKAREGVEVRFMYDDFGSRSIRKTLVQRLRNQGIEAYPFFKILFIKAANRLNFRNHRKIIVIDGKTGFVGGINVSDRYINVGTEKLYWRDTHMRIDGPGVWYLQLLFMNDWNFSSNQRLQPNEIYFPRDMAIDGPGTKSVQIAASGPDSDQPTVLFSILEAIHRARERILITTPYFIPTRGILDALIMSSLSGIKVEILVPYKSDSVIVNAAARYYYRELLAAGVKIYRYKRGFVHAKTMVVDSHLSMVGTANMDQRSFDLNFEVNAIVYDVEIAEELASVFYEDLSYSEAIDYMVWNTRPLYKRMFEKFARLLSPLL